MDVDMIKVSPVSVIVSVLVLVLMSLLPGKELPRQVE
jgi:hypothetical protein